MAAKTLPFALALSAALIIPPLALSKPSTGEVTQDQPTEETQPVDTGDMPRPSVDDIKAYFLASFSDLCAYGIAQAGGDVQPEVWHMTFRYPGEDEQSPERPMDLYQFFCNSGAYNQMLLYVTVDDYGEIKPVSFAEPNLDIVYQDPENSETPAESITVTGFTATLQLVNATYDPESGTITTSALWRGLGDAFASATYVREGIEFVLKSYDVDPSFDGEQTPERVVDYY